MEEINLHIRLKPESAERLRLLAARRKQSMTKAIQGILERDATIQQAVDAAGTVEDVLRRVVYQEQRPIRALLRRIAYNSQLNYELLHLLCAAQNQAEGGTLEEFEGYMATFRRNAAQSLHQPLPEPEPTSEEDQ